jgi:hypothetical protein
MTPSEDCVFRFCAECLEAVKEIGAWLVNAHCDYAAVEARRGRQMRTPWGIPRAVRAEQTARAEQEPGVEQLLKPDSEAKNKTRESKWCPRRHSKKSWSEFAPLRGGQLSGYCRPCANANTREYRRKNPAKPGARRGAHLLRTYGISRAEDNAMLSAQWGLCAICGKGENTIGGRTGKTPMVLSVDHDHHTGKVRGLLCSACNRGLGSFGHDAELLLAAARYLDRERG